VLRLEPRERGAEAEVRAQPEREMAFAVARDIEALGIVGASERTISR
jgi:hypothetical protein